MLISLNDEKYINKFLSVEGENWTGVYSNGYLIYKNNNSKHSNVVYLDPYTEQLMEVKRVCVK